MRSFSQLARPIVKKEARPTSEWQELGKEIQEYYKKPLYWLIAPWKDQIWYVRQVFKECRDKKKPVNYFIAILKLKNVETPAPRRDEGTLPAREHTGTQKEEDACIVAS